MVKSLEIENLGNTQKFTKTDLFEVPQTKKEKSADQISVIYI